MQELVIGGIYQHFKGNKYQVLCLAKDSETLEELVVYQDLNDINKVWVREESMFLEKISRDGKEFFRFQLVE